MKSCFAFVLLLAVVRIAVAQPNPDTLWTRTYGVSGHEGAYSIQQTTDGGYVVAGTTWDSIDYRDFYVVKIDGQGDTLWTRTYGNSLDDFVWSIQQTHDGGYVIAGVTGYGSVWHRYVVKTNSQGDTLWTRTYQGLRDGGGTSILQTEDGGYLIAGPNFDIMKVARPATHCGADPTGFIVSTSPTPFSGRRTAATLSRARRRLGVGKQAISMW
jgi:hypothetical protein